MHRLWLLLQQGPVLPGRYRLRQMRPLRRTGQKTRAVLVPRRARSRHGGQTVADQRDVVHRRRLLLQPKQPTGEPACRTALLVELCRALIQIHPCPDVLSLAMRQAQSRAGACDDEMGLLVQAVLQVQDGSAWPKGFF